jgi:type III secretion protein Q
MNALALRRVDALAHTRLQTVQRWQRGGHCAGTGRPDGACGMLSFLARGERGDWRGLIVARDWLHHSLPQLESLLAVECPATSIAVLFRAVPRALLLSVDELQYRELDDIQLLDSAQGMTQELPWLDTVRGRVWLTQLPPQRPSNAGMESFTWLEDLPLQLDLLLGVSHRSPTPLRLGPGDVLQINQLTHQCVLANRAIGVFRFTEEGLHMELIVDESISQEQAGLDHLPVRLEFVVATHDVELGTLRHLVGGQLIPLAADAAQQIEVRANGKRVARGELVQLDGQPGVELLEVYRNRCDE